MNIKMYPANRRPNRSGRQDTCSDCMELSRKGSLISPPPSAKAGAERPHQSI